MELKRTSLRWLTILAPMVFILVLVAFVLTLHEHTRKQWVHLLVMALGLGLVGVVPFSYFVFSRVERQEEEIVRRSEAMAAINAIGTGLTGFLDLERSLQAVVAKAGQLLDAEVSVLCLTDEKGSILPKVTSGPPEVFKRVGETGGRPTGSSGCLAGPMLPVGFSEGNLTCCGIKEGYMKAHLAAPLRREGRVVGALCVAGRSPRRFSPLEVELLDHLATLAAVAIENARLQEKLHNMALIEERQRIAREMHDGLAQDLGFLHMKFGQVEQMVRSEQIPDSIGELKEMKKVTREAYEDVRQSILGLRSMTSRSHGLVPTLVEYIGNFEDRTAIAVDLKVVGEETPRLPPGTEIQLIRIIQEALANVRKHAATKHASVTFSVEGQLAKILVQDEGVGFDLEAQGHPPKYSFGLETMRERVEAIGGTFAITTAPGQGTTVEVKLPLGR
ncbi:MAG: GAF domain-containing sensor histidine kinase [Nitrospinota bacterium]